MVERAALLVDEVLRACRCANGCSAFLDPLRFLFARDSQALSKVLGIVYRTIANHLIRQAKSTQTTAATGAVTLIQRFGSALNQRAFTHIVSRWCVCVHRRWQCAGVSSRA